MEWIENYPSRLVGFHNIEHEHGKEKVDCVGNKLIENERYDKSIAIFPM